MRKGLPKHLRPVVGLDIDGTLGMWHRHFMTFAEQWLGKALPSWAHYDYRVPMNAYMGVSKHTFRRIKLAFRMGGLKRSMQTYPGADSLPRSLRRDGALVIMCTTRPYLHMSNIDPDTREWLRRNKIPYDGILYGEHKYRALRDEVGRERIVAVLDDLPEMWRQAQECGLPLLARGNPHNAGLLDERPELFEVSNLHQAEEALGAMLSTWYKEKT